MGAARWAAAEAEAAWYMIVEAETRERVESRERVNESNQRLRSLRNFTRSPKVRSTALFQERVRLCLARAPKTGSSAW